ncbi:MAG: DEAD/DEAH box helicase family protein [Lachnospiraceae bacterium]|nr:DEAD/DEAH box helicase family protein [Lachnospiraceae bacterium]
MALTLNQKYSKLTELANQAHDEVISNLNTYGKTMVIRPTGFGKTRLLVNLAKEYAKEYDKKIMYVYPINIIVTEITRNNEYMTDYKKVGRNKVKYSIIKDKVEFISYATLTKRYNELGPMYWAEYIRDNFSLVILDEVHRAGSEGFSKVYDGIKELIGPDKIHLIGATATPNRMMDTDDSNVLNNIFDNIDISGFSLGDAIRTGIMPKIIYAQRIYDVKEKSAKFKEKKRQDCRISGHKFDEDSFNVELSKALDEYGDEPKYIFKYIKKAGYDLKDPDQTYFKFIVFFRNIQDLADRGPVVEDWFKRLFNETAKKELGLKKEYTINSYYVASSDTAENDLESLINEDKEHRKFFKKTNLLNDVNKQTRTVDLLFTVDMINMGYHVEDITGILMLRGTRSEIIYYQQLGRCLSVKADRSPIVYDFVNNISEKFWYKKDAKARKNLEDLLNNNSINEYNNSNRDGKNKPSDIEIILEGDDDVFEDFMTRWDNNNYSEVSYIKWLYEDRKTPICIIASDMGMSCNEVVKELLSVGVNLRTEDAMYQYVSKKAQADNSSNEYKLVKFIFSHKAKQFLQSIGATYQTIFDVLKKNIKN